MVTIAHLVEKEISRKPYLQEALIRGFINYGALADELLPKIKKEYANPIKHSAVMMALRRLVEKLERKSPKSFTFNSETSITIKSNLFNIAYKKSPTINEPLQTSYNAVDSTSGDFLAINLGNTEATIVSNKKHFRKIKEIMKDEKVIQEHDDVASISLSLSIELMDTPGFFYLVTRSLTWENINILEVVSTPTELILILDEKEVMKAYEVLKELFS